MQVRPQRFSTFNESMPRCSDRANNFIVYFHPSCCSPSLMTIRQREKIRQKIDRTEIRAGPEPGLREDIVEGISVQG
jgi:hypothetical protein